MSTPTITRVKLFTSAFIFALVAQAARADGWKVDLSRRQQQTRTQDLREPASVGAELPIDAAPTAQPPPSYFESLFQPGDIAQELCMTVAAVYQAKYRVVQRLRHQLGDLEKE